MVATMKRSLSNLFVRLQYYFFNSVSKIIIGNNRSFLLKKQSIFLFSTMLYACDTVRTPPAIAEKIKIPIVSKILKSIERPEVTSKYKEQDEHPVISIMQHSSNINNTTPVLVSNYDLEKRIDNLAEEAKEEEKQPIVTFDTRSPEELLDEARANLLTRGPYDVAITDLKFIIATQLPEKSKESHELLGYAYEKSHMFEKAMGQYARWLALYRDDSEDTTRVRQRLMSLEIMNPRETMKDVSKNKTREPRQGDNQEFSATVSEYLFANSSEAGANLTQWHTDQINSITGLQATWKLEHNQYTLSSRIRLTEVKDLTSNRGNRTNLSAAYIDFEDTYKGWNIRAGRQQAEAGAVSKFDGISSKVAVTDDLKVTVAAGTPYVGPNSHTNRKFIGAQYDYDINKEWTVSSYINRETADGFLERMAIGSEYYYRDNGTSCILRTEYDTTYHTLNLITFQTIKYVGDYDFFALYERRRSPLPFGDVALGLGILSPEKEVYSTVGNLLSRSGLTTDEIYNYIEHTTPIATSMVLGVSKKLNKDWSTTINFQRSNLSTTPGFDINPSFDPIPVQIGQSNNNSVNLHLRGENAVVKNNQVEIVIDKTSGSINSQSFTFADSYKFNSNKDNVSIMLREDSFDLNFGRTRSLSGILRGIHTVDDHFILELQYSRSLSFNPALEVKSGTPPYTTGQNFYIGFRYDY
jgi:hypothetical protein